MRLAKKDTTVVTSPIKKVTLVDKEEVGNSPDNITWIDLSRLLYSAKLYFLSYHITTLSSQQPLQSDFNKYRQDCAFEVHIQ